MDIISIIGLSLTAAVMSMLLRQYRSEYAMVISLVAGAMILSAVLKALEPAAGEMSKMVAASGIGGENAALVLKVVGVGFITQLACDACRDAGESAMASKIELSGRVAVFILALPVFGQVMGVVSGLFSLG